MTIYLVDFENVRSEGLLGVENLEESDKVVIFYSNNANSITFEVHDLLMVSKAEVDIFKIQRGGRNSLDFQLSTYLGYLVMEKIYSDIVIISKDKGFLCATSFWEENPDLCSAKISMSRSIEASAHERWQAKDYDDGMTGRFSEKYTVKKKAEPEKKAESETKPEKQTKSEKQVKAEKQTKPKKQNQKKQNSISQKKVFVAEAKLNIDNDVKDIIAGKYNENYVPVLVDFIGKSTRKEELYTMLVQNYGQIEGLDLYKLIRSKYVTLKRK